MKYDVIIIGAGPGGMFAAYKLAGNLKVAVFEMGRDIGKRKCPKATARNASLVTLPTVLVGLVVCLMESLTT